MPKLERNFSQILLSGVLDYCRDEPLLSGLGVDHVLELPQRVIRRRTPSDPAPPLAQMISTRRGDVRVRLYLWLWALVGARGQPRTPYRRTSGEWALLLNLLAEPAANNQRARAAAARRVSRAGDYLESHSLIRRTRRDEIQLLDPTGHGEPFEPRSEVELADRDRRRAELARWTNPRTRELWEDPPLKIPAALWTNGTVSALSGAALATLLLLWDQPESEDGYRWPPRIRTHQYGLSSDTWQNGTTELLELGCIRRRQGALLFRGGSNIHVDTDRYAYGWKIDRNRLLGKDRERYA
jgi:hypothetical protein